MLKPYCYYNSQIKPVAKVGLPLNDLGVLRGYGVFDFIRTYNGKPFHLANHYKRFKNSAKLLGLSVPISEKELSAVIWSLRKKNKCAEASIRLVLTGGVAEDGISLPKTGNFFILMESLYEFPLAVFQKGAKLITSDYVRTIPEAKNTNYIEAVRLQKAKRKGGAIEVLYVHDGLVSEATTSNFFIIKNNILITPKEGILGGVTRKVVLELAKKHKLKVEERPVRVSELKTADECFISATNKKITPIVQIDNFKIASATPGPHTRALLSAFEEITKNY